MTIKRRSLAMLTAALCLQAGAVQADTLFAASFENTLAAEGGGGFAAPEFEADFAGGRLGRGLRLTRGTGPLIYSDGTGDLTEQGIVSFWIGSLDLEGHSPENAAFFSMQIDGVQLVVYKDETGHLSAVETRNGVSRAFQYPLYDMQPRYPSPWGEGGTDLRHFVLYQWGGRDEGLFVNAIPGVAMDPPATLPPTIAQEGQIVIGDPSAGLIFDEVVVATEPKSAREVRDNYIAYLSGAYQPPEPRITVTGRRAPITIDGYVSEEEWGETSAISGLHELQSRRMFDYDATFFITYDDEKFYIAMKTFAEYPLDAREGHRDEIGEDFMVCMDDSMEVLLMPYESIRYDYFHFLGNAAGYFADQIGTNPNWDGDWEYAAQVVDGVWIAELAIPYESLAWDSERAVYPAGEGMWRFNLARNWNNVYPFHWAGLCYTQHYGDYHKFALMQFDRDGISSQFRGVEIEEDTARFSFRLIHHGTDKRELELNVSAYTRVLPFTQERKIFSIEGGETRDISIDLPLRGVDKAMMEWSITDLDSGAFLYRASGGYPLFEGHAPAYVERLAAQRRRAEELAGEAAAEDAAPKKDEPQPAAEAPKLADGHILWPTTDVVQEALTRRLAWKNNDLGYSTEVPPPWTDVEEEDGSIRVWERTYDVKDALILGGVNIKGQEMLAGPVALVLEKDGVQTRFEKGQTAVINQDATRVDFVSIGGDERLTVSTRSWIEYDGCMWTEMKLHPREPVAFDSMWLELPFVPEQARNFNYWIDKESGSNAGLLPDDGIRQTYRPYIWLGDVDRGLSWFTEEYREWFVEHPERTACLFVEPGNANEPTRLRIMLAVAPSVLDASMAMEFGLMGTPMRPMPKNWRQYDHYCGWSKIGAFSRWGSGYFIKEPDDPEDFQTRLERFHNQSPYVLATPNVGSYYFTETNYRDGRLYPDWWLWGQEFAQRQRTQRPGFAPWRKPSDPNFYHVGYTTALPTREYTDLFLYKYHKLMTDYPLLKAIYMDSCIPVGDNPLAGSGYTDRYGNRRGTIEIMRSRIFMQRLYTMFWQLRGDPDENPWLIYLHSSNQIAPPIHSFATSFLQGEGLSVGPRAFGHDPINALPMESMRVAFSGHPYGWIEQFLGLYSNNPETLSQLTAMFLMHDHNQMGRLDHRNRDRLALVIQRAGLRAPDDHIRFFPYWDEPDAARSLTEGGYVNAYVKTRENRTILTLASLHATDAPTSIHVQFNRAELDLPDGTLALTDLYTGESFAVNGNTFTIPIRRNDYRILELKPVP